MIWWGSKLDAMPQCEREEVRQILRGKGFDGEGLDASIATSTAAAGLAFFAIGSLRSPWSPAAWWRAGLETASIGLAAAAVAYIVGDLLARL